MINRVILCSTEDRTRVRPSSCLLRPAIASTIKIWISAPVPWDRPTPCLQGSQEGKKWNLKESNFCFPRLGPEPPCNFYGASKMKMRPGMGEPQIPKSNPSRVESCLTSTLYARCHGDPNEIHIISAVSRNVFRRVDVG
jgi:hypothetical protein